MKASALSYPVFFSSFSCLPGSRLVSGPPAPVQVNEEREPECAGEVAAQHIEHPMFAFPDARKAHLENVERQQNLEWDQPLRVFPPAYRLCQGQKEQEAVEDDDMLCVPGGKTVEIEH